MKPISETNTNFEKSKLVIRALVGMRLTLVSTHSVYISSTNNMAIPNLKGSMVTAPDMDTSVKRLVIRLRVLKLP